MSLPYFHFRRLIEKYASPIDVLADESGHFDDKGEYAADSSDRVSLCGAVLRREARNSVRAEGANVGDECVLYLLTDPGIPLVGAHIVFGNKKYKVTEKLENAEFTGVWRFSLRYISAFREDDK